MAIESPKRKRGDESPGGAGKLTPYPILQSDLQVREEGSPKTAVTKGFQRLQIQQIENYEAEDADERERKRRVCSAEEIDETPTSSPTPCPAPETTGVHGKAESVSPAVPFTFTHTDSLPGPPNTDTRPKSPVMSNEVNEVNEFYWHDSEITGHDPVDPMDDGYGINGIGFKPTPAIAFQRSQRRKQQLIEYRNREAREARQRRSERRRMGSAEVQDTSVSDENNKTRIQVRFEDG
ncbi:uncharacterized protein HMPREF1541_00206 [Cyphellophora europaea CBS 101466]|uniref:Uncharacterized protein n=1 Tax=Cyphellophora europaea (strain CBS 101466) TaxID=1220924 RepID=W2SDB5_CYPE1|nr:uncharacterized protein HMPREF1541_00206 [Cyphellophora europaea CBS 101466]ETN46023.1 hypothetical protein HMPREF1541_00206 [Cyphellophora europaea CBS 101466]